MEIIIKLGDEEVFEFESKIQGWLERIEKAVEKIEAQAEDCCEDN